MFLPLSDSPTASSLPTVTWLLIALNVAVYLAITLPLGMQPPAFNDPLLPEYLRSLGVQGAVPYAAIRDQVTAYDLVIFKYGFRPAAFSLVSLFSSFFLHAGFFHLAGNMLFLYIFGANVEQRLGPLKYLFAYLFFGVSATLFFALFALGSNVPLVGASGAISGVMGCYFLWFPRNRVRVFVFLFPFIVTTVLIPARWVLGFFLLIDNLLPFLFSGASGGGVAHGAHIGGFVAGLGLGFASERIKLVQPWFKTSARAQETCCTPPEISSAIAAGKLASASRCYLGLENATQRQAVAPELVLTLGDYLWHKGEQQAALRIFRRFIAERPNSPGLDRAYLTTGKILLHQARYATSAYHYFLAAVDLAATPEVAAEARTGIARIEASQHRRGQNQGP